MKAMTDATVLDHLMALNLDVSIWSARKRLKAADLGNADLPPEEIASLGSKRICDPGALRIFTTLKTRAVTLLDKYGVRFLGGWGIPLSLADEIVYELETIRNDFMDAKESFLKEYDMHVNNWIQDHPGWEHLLGESTVSSDYVRSRMNFKWQLFQLRPPEDSAVHEGMQTELQELGNTLYGEVARAATDAWHNCYVGKDKITRKALSPLRSIQRKLLGLTFVEPRVAPAAALLETAFNSIPSKGPIEGADLIMLQGVVSLLREPATLLEHGQKMLDGQKATDVLHELTAPRNVSEGDPSSLGKVAYKKLTSKSTESSSDSSSKRTIQNDGLW
ncbi:MAG: DUF3150 domain-containing protein [Desulfovibrio sp.]